MIKQGPKKKTKKWTRLNENVSDSEIEFIGRHKIETVPNKLPEKRKKVDPRVENEDAEFYEKLWKLGEEERKRVGSLEIDNYMLLKISKECCTCDAREIVEKVILKKQ